MKTVPLPDNYYFELTVTDLDERFRFTLKLIDNSSYYGYRESPYNNVYYVEDDVVDLEKVEATLIEYMDELIKEAGLNIDREKELKRLQKFCDEFNKTQGLDARKHSVTDNRAGTQTWIQRWFG